MKKKSIVVLVTLLVLAFGASMAMAQGWGGCGWGGPGMGYATNGSSGYYCPMRGTPGNYYCPVTGNGYCPMVAAPGGYYQTDNTQLQNYGPSSGYYTAAGWGCW